jgi:hypothetical protein
MTEERTESARGDAAYWAFVLIWAGLVLAAESTGVLARLGGAGAWTWLFCGAGVLALVGGIRRLAATPRANPVAILWDCVWGAVLLTLGLTVFDIGLPLILVAIGVGLLGTTYLRR